MAEDRDDSQRTEEPTQRRLDDAHQKGDVVKSTEVSTFVLLSAGALAVAGFGTYAGETFARDFLVFLERPHDLMLGGAGTLEIFRRAALGLLAMLAPAILLLMAAAAGGTLVQHRPVFTAERMKPSLSKLSLLKGLKRIFGLDGLTNLVKGVLKLALVGAAAMAAIWPERERITEALGLSPTELAGLATALMLRLLVAALAILAVIAALDYFYQRFRFFERHKMTRQEVRDEHKQTEGDPQIRAKIRQIRQERSRSRMMAAVPEATVVITNPTHYAVALKYESGRMAAPVCVAKGVDAVAQRIRAVAEEHEVPLVENPPLARALYAAVDLEEEIPAEHYKAVAQIVGYVMRLRGELR